ncbi:MAG: hypothetical protein Q9163_001355 [Psora crenata]
MFVEPDKAEPRPTVIADPTAPGRSLIRRRTVRHSPGSRVRQQVPSSPNVRRQTAGNSRIRQLADRRPLLEDIRREDHSRSRPASGAATTSEDPDLGAALNHGNPPPSHVADVLHTQANRQGLAQSGQQDLRDAVYYERPSPRSWIRPTDAMSDDGNLRPSVQTDGATESDELRNSPLADDRQAPRQGHIPNISAESPGPSAPRLYSRPVGSASFTPGFPPAHRPVMDHSYGTLSARQTDLMILAHRIRGLRSLPEYREDLSLPPMLADIDAMMVRDSSELPQDYLITETEYIYSIRERVEQMAQRAASSRDTHSTHDRSLTDLPLLRRIGQRRAVSSVPTLSHIRRDYLGGLGDRQRSFSPDPISWDTMLTTIPPDDRVPSAHSSFTSASGSASASSLGSHSAPASSYSTLITIPSTSAEAEPCPAIDASSSDSDSLGEETLDAATPPHRPASTGYSTYGTEHLDRIESISRRLEEQRSRGEHTAHRSRMLQRETELRRIEANLLRLERQIEQERLILAERQRPSGVHAGRERL